MERLALGRACCLFIKNLFKFSGRASRSEFWWIILVWLVIYGLCRAFYLPGVSYTVVGIFSIALLPLYFRRMHDVGKSGIVDILVLIFLSIVESGLMTVGSEYGIMCIAVGIVFYMYYMGIVLAGKSKETIGESNKLSRDKCSGESIRASGLRMLLPEYDGGKKLADVIVNIPPEQLRGRIQQMDTNSLEKICRELELYIKQNQIETVTGLEPEIIIRDGIRELLQSKQ